MVQKLLLKARSRAAVIEQLRQWNVRESKIVDEIPYLKGYVIVLPPKFDHGLLANPMRGISLVRSQRLLWPQTAFPLHRPLPKFNLPASRRVGTKQEWTHRGRGVTVAILDNGVFPHPELAGRLDCMDFTGEKPVKACSVSNQPYATPHGTNAAGAIAGKGYIASLAKLLSFRCETNIDAYQSISAVLEDGLHLGVKLLYSAAAFSGPEEDDVVKLADHASELGITVVGAWGDPGAHVPSILARAKTAIVVGAYEVHAPGPGDNRVVSKLPVGPQNLAPPKPTVLGFWGNFTVTSHEIDKNGKPVAAKRSNFGGTSAASALVAGEIATWLGADKTLTPAKVLEILSVSSRPIHDGSGKTYPLHVQGYGALDEGAARKLLTIP